MRKRGTMVTLLAGIAAGMAAAAWLVRSRVRAVDDAPTRAVADGGDDLTEIKGIGPAYRRRLAAAGITAFPDLVAAGPAAVADAAGVAEATALKWIAQAAALYGAR